MSAALLARPELAFVELFEAGVEPDNVACRRCLKAAGFCVHSPEPDCEGMLYYRAATPRSAWGCTTARRSSAPAIGSERRSTSQRVCPA
jgi:hypothetical protein